MTARIATSSVSRKSEQPDRQRQTPVDHSGTGMQSVNVKMKLEVDALIYPTLVISPRKLGTTRSVSRVAHTSTVSRTSRGCGTALRESTLDARAPKRRLRTGRRQKGCMSREPSMILAPHTKGLGRAARIGAQKKLDAVLYSRTTGHNS